MFYYFKGSCLGSKETLDHLDHPGQQLPAQIAAPTVMAILLPRLDTASKSSWALQVQPEVLGHPEKKAREDTLAVLD